MKVAASNIVGISTTQTSSPMKLAPYPQIPGKPSSIVVTPGSQQLTVSFSYPRVPFHGIYCNGGGPSATASDNECSDNAGGYAHGSVTEADGGSTISHYIVELDVLGTFDSNMAYPNKQSISVAFDSSGSYSTVITGLTSGRTYYVRASAVNAAGIGPTCSSGDVYCDDGSTLSGVPTS